MKKIIILAAVASALFTIWFYVRHPLAAKMEIRGHVFTVEIAATNAEKEKGLGYRDSLPQESGMLFPYDHKERYSYWMKGMRFPIDIIWIEDHTIVDISKNVPVATSGGLRSYAPAKPVNKVLELNAGTADRIGAKIGDTALIVN